MYNIVKKSRAIQCVILLLTLVVMITIFPVRMWNETIPSVSNQIMAGSSDSAGEDYLLQRFIAQYDHLGTVNLYVIDFENGWKKDQRVDNFIFRMMDSDMQIMFEQYVDVRFIDIPGFCPIYINEDLEAGKDYYFFIQGREGSRVWFGLEETEKAGTQYVSRLVYNYDEIEGYNIIGEYYYSVPLRKENVFAYDAILLVIAAVLIGAVELYFRTFKKDKYITVERAFRFTANTLLAAVTAAGLYTITIKRFFSGQIIDNIFYTVGLALFSCTLFYAINHKRDRANYVPLLDKLRAKWPNYLQIIFIAGAVWACCNYMNGLYDIHHRIAERQFIIFFALIVLTMCKKKDIINKVSLVYILAAAAGVYRYYSIYVDYLTMDELDVQALKWGTWAIVFAGFVIINLLTGLITKLIKKEKLNRISPAYGIVVGLFFVLIIVFRNTRWWTVAMAVSYTVFYIRYALWDKKEYLLKNAANGLILHFLCSMLFSLLHRPFLSWIYPRFPFIFHTVTVTAVYISLIICAALVILVDKYKKTDNIKDLWKELLVLGLTGTYMLFTASRTGFLAIGVMAIITLFMTVNGKGFRKLIPMGKLVVMIVISVIWCFPIGFTAQRILPAISSDVDKFEVEEFPDAITRGNEWDSMYYITVERFVEVFNNKIFGIEESGSGSYERSEEYQKYRAKRFNTKGEVVWEGHVNDLYEDDSNGETVSDEKPQLNIIGTKTEEERAADEEKAAQLELGAGGYAPDQPEQEEEVLEDVSVYEKTEQYANGRMDIFRAYIEQLNLTGHDEMGALLPDGNLAVHAHNIYLQIAYDHGIIVGIMFLVVGAFTFIQGCIYYRRKKDEVACAIMPVAVITAFAMAGLVEWIFHLCHPAGFVLLLVLAPLLFDMGNQKDRANEKR